jgi:hypothetical protein
MDSNTLSPAQQACGSCRRQKRKCDKVLPICGFCSHTKRVCDYEDLPKSSPSAADFAALQSRLLDLERRLGALTAGPTSLVGAPHETSYETKTATDQEDSLFTLPTLFLDLDCFKWMGLQLAKPQVPLPMVSEALMARAITFARTRDWR